MPSCGPFTIARAAWKVRKGWKAAGEAGDNLRKTDNLLDEAIYLGKGVEAGRNAMRSARKVVDELDKRQERKEERKEKRRRPSNDRIRTREQHEGIKQHSGRKHRDQRHAERDQLPKRPEDKLHRESTAADRPRRRKRTLKKHRSRGNVEGGLSPDTARHHSDHRHSKRSSRKHRPAEYGEHRETRRISSSHRNHKPSRGPNELGRQPGRVERNERGERRRFYEEVEQIPEIARERSRDRKYAYENPRSSLSRRSRKPHQARVSDARTNEM